MSKGPEAKLKAECRVWLRQRGAYVFSPVQVGLGSTTLDDLVCCEGRFFAFEYKRPDTRPPPTKRQEMVMEAIKDAGGIIAVVYELADVQRIIRQSIDVL